MKRFGEYMVIPPMPDALMPFELWRQAHWSTRVIYYRTTIKEDENSVLSPECYEHFVKVHGKFFRVYRPTYTVRSPGEDMEDYFFVAHEDAAAWAELNQWGGKTVPKVPKRRPRVMGL